MDLLELYLDAWKRKDGELISHLDYIVNEEDVLGSLPPKERAKYEVYIGLRDGEKLKDISQQAGYSPFVVYRFSQKFSLEGFLYFPQKKGRRGKKRLNSPSIDFLLADPSFTFQDITQRTGAGSRYLSKRAKDLQKKGAFIPERKGGPKKQKFHPELLEDALSFMYSPDELAEKYHFTRRMVYYIFEREGGFTTLDLKIARKKTKKEYYTQLLNLLQSYSSQKEIEEKDSLSLD